MTTGLLKVASQLDDLTVAQLIEQSAEVARNAVDLYLFTRSLGKFSTTRVDTIPPNDVGDSLR